MDGNAVSMLLLAGVCLAHLALGIAIGWWWGNAVGERRESLRVSAHIERMFQRTDALFSTVRTVLWQTREYASRLNQLRKAIDNAPAVATSPVAQVVESLERLQGELTATRDELQQRLNLAQEALVAARVIYRVSPAPAHELATATTGGQRGAGPPTPKEPHAVRPGIEARTEERHPYRCVQRVAPYVQEHIPTREMFQEVQCWDLSTGGVSFLTASPPSSELIVITIGEEPDLTYRTARVAHVTEVSHPTGSGRLYRVGCQFTGKLHRHLF
jgi:hypothetical protein